ncbi:acyl-CoA desaturase [Hahella sp. NBU794]|uniref:acyl-CoA desaturase n=1 Tax=Hahella sp. NBU794 TaxID=3422590 RepID=UPI003D6E6A09
MQGLGRLLSWIDNDRKGMSVDVGRDAVDWYRVWPFVGIHLACLAVLWVGWSPVAVWVAVGAYLLRMFAITAFYHRYFAHKSFRTSRLVQFVFAVLGASATQRGPLWWSAHHRHHHRTSDTEADPHSPRHGFWRSHAGWFLGGKYFKAPLNLVKDFSQYPELRWLDRFDMCVPLAFGFSMWCLGEGLAYMAPQLQTSGWQMLVWGYFISTVVLIHATLAINSLAHRWGRRRYETGDDSRNNFLLALLTLGEGWHNNHHHYSGSARQGFFWWELDLSYYLLRLMAVVGLIWDLRDVPEHKKWAHKPEVSGLTLNGGRR